MSNGFILWTILIIFSLNSILLIDSANIFRRQDPNNCFATASAAASRSATITLVNKSGKALTLNTATTTAGKWTSVSCDANSLKTIANGATFTFASQSDGFLTGTDGLASYSIEPKDPFTIRWSVPFAGHHSCTIDNLDTSKYTPSVNRDITGNDEKFTVTITAI